MWQLFYIYGSFSTAVHYCCYFYYHSKMTSTPPTKWILFWSFVNYTYLSYPTLLCFLLGWCKCDSCFIFMAAFQLLCSIVFRFTSTVKRRLPLLPSMICFALLCKITPTSPPKWRSTQCLFWKISRIVCVTKEIAKLASQIVSLPGWTST